MECWGRICVLKRSGENGSRFPVVGKCLIGTALTCDIRLHLKGVAGEHCVVYVDDNGQGIIENLTQECPTLLNDSVLKVGQRRRLCHGDMFTVVDRKFVWEYLPTSRFYVQNSSEVTPLVNTGVTNGLVTVPFSLSSTPHSSNRIAVITPVRREDNTTTEIKTAKVKKSSIPVTKFYRHSLQGTHSFSKKKSSTRRSCAPLLANVAIEKPLHSTISPAAPVLKRGSERSSRKSVSASGKKSQGSMDRKSKSVVKKLQIDSGPSYDVEVVRKDSQMSLQSESPSSSKNIEKEAPLWSPRKSVRVGSEQKKAEFKSRLKTPVKRVLDTPDSLRKNSKRIKLSENLTGKKNQPPSSNKSASKHVKKPLFSDMVKKRGMIQSKRTLVQNVGRPTQIKVILKKQRMVTPKRISAIKKNSTGHADSPETIIIQKKIHTRGSISGRKATPLRKTGVSVTPARKNLLTARESVTNKTPVSEDLSLAVNLTPLKGEVSKEKESRSPRTKRSIMVEKVLTDNETPSKRHRTSIGKITHGKKNTVLIENSNTPDEVSSVTQILARKKTPFKGKNVSTVHLVEELKVSPNKPLLRRQTPVKESKTPIRKRSPIKETENSPRRNVSMNEIAVSVHKISPGNKRTSHRKPSLAKESTMLLRQQSPAKENKTPLRKESPVKESKTPLTKQSPPKEGKTSSKKLVPMKEIRLSLGKISPGNRRKTPLRIQNITRKSKTPLGNQSPAKDSKTPLRNQSPAKDSKSPLRNQSPAKGSKTPLRNQSPAKGSKTPLRNQSPAKDSKTRLRNQSPAKDSKTLLRNQSPAKDSKTPLRNQSPAKGSKTPLRNQSPAKGSKTPLRNQSPAKGSKTPLRNQSPAKGSKTPLRNQSPAKDSKTPLRKQSPAKDSKTPLRKQSPAKDSKTPLRKQSPAKESKTPLRKQSPAKDSKTPLRKQSPAKDSKTPLRKLSPAKDSKGPQRKESPVKESKTQLTKQSPPNEGKTSSKKLVPVKEIRLSLGKISPGNRRKTPLRIQNITRKSKTPLGNQRPVKDSKTPLTNQSTAKDSKTPLRNQSPAKDIKSPLRNQSPAKGSKTPLRNQSPAKDSKSPLRNQSPAKGSKTPLRNQSPAKDSKTPLRNQSPAKDSKSPLRNQSPAKGSKTPLKNQSPAKGSKTPLRNQSPAKDSKTRLRNQSPAKDSKTLLRNQSPAKDSKTPLRNQSPAKGSKTPLRNQSPAKDSKTPLRKQSSAKERKMSPREQAPAKEHKSSPGQLSPLKQVISKISPARRSKTPLRKQSLSKESEKSPVKLVKVKEIRVSVGKRSSVESKRSSIKTSEIFPGKHASKKEGSVFSGKRSQINESKKSSVKIALTHASPLESNTVQKTPVTFGPSTPVGRKSNSTGHSVKKSIVGSESEVYSATRHKKIQANAVCGSPELFSENDTSISLSSVCTPQIPQEMFVSPLSLSISSQNTRSMKSSGGRISKRRRLQESPTKTSNLPSVCVSVDNHLHFGVTTPERFANFPDFTELSKVSSEPKSHSFISLSPVEDSCSKVSSTKETPGSRRNAKNTNNLRIPGRHSAPSQSHKKIPKTSQVRRSLKNDWTGLLDKTTKTSKSGKSPQNNLRDVTGVAKFHRTLKVQTSPKNDLSDVRGVRKLLATPKVQGSPKNDLRDVRGVKKLLGTPKVQASPKNDLTDVRGVRKLLATPKVQASPKNDLRDVRGVKKLLGTPKVQASPKNDLSDVRGVWKLLATPKVQASPKNDLRDVRGVKRLLGTPKVQVSPKNDLTDVRGVRKLLATPKVQASPKNDLRDVRGVKKLLGTPKVQASPRNDLSDVRGVKKLLRTPRHSASPRNDLTNVSGVEELFVLHENLNNKELLVTQMEVENTASAKGSRRKATNTVVVQRTTRSRRKIDTSAGEVDTHLVESPIKRRKTAKDKDNEVQEVNDSEKVSKVSVAECHSELEENLSVKQKATSKSSKERKRLGKDVSTYDNKSDESVIISPPKTRQTRRKGNTIGTPDQSKPNKTQTEDSPQSASAVDIVRKLQATTVIKSPTVRHTRAKAITRNQMRQSPPVPDVISESPSNVKNSVKMNKIPLPTISPPKTRRMRTRTNVIELQDSTQESSNATVSHSADSDQTSTVSKPKVSVSPSLIVKSDRNKRSKTLQENSATPESKSSLSSPQKRKTRLKKAEPKSVKFVDVISVEQPVVASPGRATRSRKGKENIEEDSGKCVVSNTDEVETRSTRSRGTKSRITEKDVTESVQRTTRRKKT